MREQKIYITSESLIKEVQEEFSQVFPYLRIEFTRKPHPFMNSVQKILALPNEFIIGHSITNKEEKILEITPSMTLKELGDSFENKFGVVVQLQRKSASLWLKVTMTDNWTMKQQNELGSEISTLFETGT